MFEPPILLCIIGYCVVLRSGSGLSFILLLSIIYTLSLCSRCIPSFVTLRIVHRLVKRFFRHFHSLKTHAKGAAPFLFVLLLSPILKAHRLLLLSATSFPAHCIFGTVAIGGQNLPRAALIHDGNLNGGNRVSSGLEHVTKRLISIQAATTVRDIKRVAPPNAITHQTTTSATNPLLQQYLSFQNA